MVSSYQWILEKIVNFSLKKRIIENICRKGLPAEPAKESAEDRGMR